MIHPDTALVREKGEECALRMSPVSFCELVVANLRSPMPSSARARALISVSASPKPSVCVMRELKALDLPADTIFRHLQDYAGFNGEPKRQGAALAVLAYFFDSCDIF